MRNLLRDISLIGKAASGVLALGLVPGVTPTSSIVVLVLSALLKDLADNFYDRIRGEVTATLKQVAAQPIHFSGAQQSGPASVSASTSSDPNAPLMKIASLVVVLVCSLWLVGCGGSAVAPTPTPAVVPTTSTTTTTTATPASDAATLVQNIVSVAVSIETNPLVAQTNGSAAAYAIVKYADPSNPTQTAIDGNAVCTALLTTANGQVISASEAQTIVTNLKTGANSAFYATAAQMLSAGFAAISTSLSSQGASTAQIQAAEVSFLTGAQTVFSALSTPASAASL